MKDDNKLTKIYFEEVGRESLLDSDTERMLSEKILKGDDKAVARLATANLRFVAHVAKKYAGKGVDFDDLVSEGNIALVEAARRFDASHGNRFISYAAPFIQKAMKNVIDEQAGIVSTPKNASEVEKKRGMALSVDAPLGGMENVNLLSVLTNESSPSPENGIDGGEDAAEILKLLSVLNERERNVMVCSFGIGRSRMTMAEIGENMGLKRERVRQIRKKAIRKMEKCLKKEEDVE